MPASPALELSLDLLRRPSITPRDAGCQEVLAARLDQAGFKTESMPYGEVSNLWALHGTDGPLLLLLGHTDVVPPGAEQAWDTPPFAPDIRDGRLYGRGTADMKCALAAMLVACENFVAAHPQHGGRLGFLVTSDEEGPARDGVQRVMQELQNRGETIDWCLIGEPSCENAVGDTIKNGRRGSLCAVLQVPGVQGHIAYPHRADNPIPRALPALQALLAEHWDDGDEHFPPTSFQFSNVDARSGAANVSPGSLRAEFNFRYSAELDEPTIVRRTEEILSGHELHHTLEWYSNGRPFITRDGRLLEEMQRIVHRHSGFTPTLSTGGGTSDGRFVAPLGAQVAEFGMLNCSAHQVNEWVAAADVELLVSVYEDLLQSMLLNE